MQLFLKLNADFESRSLKPMEWVMLPDDDLLSAYYKTLNCESIEVLSVNIGSGSYLMVIDECGKLDHKRLNTLASVIFIYDFIVGDVLIGVETVNEFGEHNIGGLQDTDQMCRLYEALLRYQ